MGDAGKDAERQVGNVLFRSLGSAKAERGVGVAPEKERGNIDDRNVAAAEAAHPAAAKQRAIPVDHRREPAGPGRVRAIDLQVGVGEARRVARAAANDAGSGAGMVASQHELRQPWELEEKHVPGFQELRRAS